MEIFPYGDILLDEFRPQLRKLIKIIIVYWAIVGAAADHVEQGGDAVEGVADEEDGSFRIKFSFAISFWIMGFYYPYSFINQPFPR